MNGETGGEAAAGFNVRAGVERNATDAELGRALRHRSDLASLTCYLFTHRGEGGRGPVIEGVCAKRRSF